MSKDKKKKKQKTVYIDDGRTIADMSGLGRTRDSGEPKFDRNGRRRATAREQFETYKAAVKTMLLPMFITIGIICVAFGLLYLIFELAA